MQIAPISTMTSSTTITTSGVCRENYFRFFSKKASFHFLKAEGNSNK